MIRKILITIIASLFLFNNALAQSQTELQMTQTVAKDIFTDFQVRPEKPTALSVFSFNYEAKPGQTIEDTILITNLSEEENHISLYPVDSKKTKSNTTAFATKNEPKKDVATWIKIQADSEEFTIPAKGFIKVPFSITVPENTPLGDYIGGLAGTKLFINSAKVNTYSMNTELRLISNVNIKVTNTPKELPKWTPPKIFSWYFYASIAFFIGVMAYIIITRLKKKKHVKKS